MPGNKQMNKFIFDFNEKSEDYVTPVKTGIIRPNHMVRQQPLGLPQVSEVSLVRHFTNLSRKNFGVDNGFYPLGSCTMKYNPKINEKIASLKDFTEPHPLMDEDLIQGHLEMLYEMEQFLKEISGMAGITFQPSAGAHGEITGIILIKAFHNHHKDIDRKKIIVPDSSHGTNPATASIAGFEVVEIKSNPEGLVDLTELEKVLDDQVAALMLTNPNTLGLFEKHILKISKMVHDVGGLLYYDGANLNPLFGRVKIADMGFDVVHFNLHKSFSTPHGGGGPGAGPVGVNKKIMSFLPVPLIKKKDDRYTFDYNVRHSIGKMRSFYGNFNVILKSYFYILSLGLEGLRSVSEKAILNANYLKNQLSRLLELPYKNHCMHEFVLSGKTLNQWGLHTIDLAKRLIDYGYHPPTVYFPLIVDEAIMIEPTETESKETLDTFARDLERILKEAKSDPDKLKKAPHSTPVGRLDEVTAARQPIVTYDEYKDQLRTSNLEPRT
ncbi:MAG: aminomethyl-transferring glycine dehydrogenase subunit GcvPB [Spirochaetes bacterium]|nr:aminomethyl-transferring glycine dehydrogenase subunit GcvPB [Spirochaetota bacterium]